MSTTTRLLLLFTKFRDLRKKPVAPHFFVFCVQGAFFFFSSFLKLVLCNSFDFLKVFQSFFVFHSFSFQSSNLTIFKGMPFLLSHLTLAFWSTQA